MPGRQQAQCWWPKSISFGQHRLSAFLLHKFIQNLLTMQYLICLHICILVTDFLLNLQCIPRLRVYQICMRYSALYTVFNITVELYFSHSKLHISKSTSLKTIIKYLSSTSTREFECNNTNIDKHVKYNLIKYQKRNCRIPITIKAHHWTPSPSLVQTFSGFSTKSWVFCMSIKKSTLSCITQ